MFRMLNIYILERINLFLKKKTLENDKNQIEVKEELKHYKNKVC